MMDREKYVCWMLSDLHKCSWQVESVPVAYFILGGALELHVLVSRVKTPSSDLWWLYLAMVSP
jgi:hypothetical protein